jgi:hypothetical protein
VSPALRLPRSSVWWKTICIATLVHRLDTPSPERGDEDIADDEHSKEARAGLAPVTSIWLRCDGLHVTAVGYHDGGNVKKSARSGGDGRL